MKTVKNISLTLLLIALTSTLSAAGNIRTFKSQLNNGTTLTIVSKIETLFTESIPGYDTFIRQYRTRMQLVKLDVNNHLEMPVAGELALISAYNTNQNPVAEFPLATLNSKPEELIEEDAYSIALLEEFQKSFFHHAYEVKIEGFMKAEKELEEEMPCYNLARSVFSAK